MQERWQCFLMEAGNRKHQAGYQGVQKGTRCMASLSGRESENCRGRGNKAESFCTQSEKSGYNGIRSYQNDKERNAGYRELYHESC